MELTYPIILILGIVALVGIFFFKFKKKDVYQEGKKVANTHYTKNLPYYQELMKKQKILSIAIQATCAFSIVLCFVLIARPAEVQTSNSITYNRDIFLCMDISSSVDELNYELVGELKEIVKNLHGERFGISIFNTSSTLLVPLTDDYDYVNSILDELRENLQKEIARSNGVFSLDRTLYSMAYLTSGTLEGNETRGSSLIGDGLATCLLNFTDLEEDKTRTRIVLFSTDNELAGTEIVNLQEAAQMAKEKRITVYGLAPESIREEDKQTFQRAVETTGGKYYTANASTTVKQIISEIQKSEKSMLKGQKETRKIDKPTIPFLILVLAITTLLILNKKVNL